MTTKLTIELVPSTCWYTNVRSNVSKERWDKIKKLVYAATNHKCSICGGRGYKWPVEAHEIFEYDDTTHIQKLVKIVALCPLCHSVKHIGRTRACGDFKAAVKHLASINGWSLDDANNYIEVQFEEWSRRSKYKWELDLTILEKEYG